jgi:multiple sugar transport system permease protein
MRQAGWYSSGAALSILLFPLLWGDFFAPLILLSDGSKFTLPVAVVACVIVFLVLQRHYVQGFTSGAVRG